MTLLSDKYPKLLIRACDTTSPYTVILVEFLSAFYAKFETNSVVIEYVSIKSFPKVQKKLISSIKSPVPQQTKR